MSNYKYVSFESFILNLIIFYFLLHFKLNFRDFKYILTTTFVIMLNNYYYYRVELRFDKFSPRFWVHFFVSGLFHTNFVFVSTRKYSFSRTIMATEKVVKYNPSVNVQLKHPWHPWPLLICRAWNYT